MALSDLSDLTTKLRYEYLKYFPCPVVRGESVCERSYRAFRSSHRRRSVKKMMLLKNSQNSQKNICARLSFLIRTPFLQNTSRKLLLDFPSKLQELPGTLKCLRKIREIRVVSILNQLFIRGSYKRFAI